jgi:hypothetical protein
MQVSVSCQLLSALHQLQTSPSQEWSWGVWGRSSTHPLQLEKLTVLHQEAALASQPGMGQWFDV